MLPIIDAHHHIWRLAETPWLNGPPQPRIFGDYAALRRDYLIEELVQAFRPHGVAKSVYIQINVAPSQPEQLTESQARCNGYAKERFQSLSLHRFKERLRLLRGEHFQLGPSNARSIRQRSGITANEPPDRHQQCRGLR